MKLLKVKSKEETNKAIKLKEQEKRIVYCSNVNCFNLISSLKSESFENERLI